MTYQEQHPQDEFIITIDKAIFKPIRDYVEKHEWIIRTYVTLLICGFLAFFIYIIIDLKRND